MLSWVFKQMSFNPFFYWSAHDVLHAFTDQFCHDVQALYSSHSSSSHVSLHCRCSKVFTWFSVACTDIMLCGSPIRQRNCVKIVPKNPSIHMYRLRRPRNITISCSIDRSLDPSFLVCQRLTGCWSHLAKLPQRPWHEPWLEACRVPLGSPLVQQSVVVKYANYLGSNVFSLVPILESSSSFRLGCLRTPYFPPGRNVLSLASMI